MISTLLEVAIKDGWTTDICAEYGRVLVDRMSRWLEAVIKNHCGRTRVSIQTFM